jgi:hypothetical protein
MVLDTVAGHAATFAAIEAFLESSELTLELDAAGRFPLDVDASFLRVLRFVKTGALLRTREDGPDVLEVAGRADLLALWAEDLLFPEDDAQGHNHPEQSVAIRGLDSRSGLTIGVDPRSERVIIQAYIPEDEE